VDEAISGATVVQEGEVEDVIKDALQREEDVKDGAWLVGEEEMRGFVNSERWSLGQLASLGGR
jgi:hypothetical protein